ncbi:MAG: protein translocase subunit SecF [Patescibacteria group bacterium]|nr:protein translocase subunit SecF [bacterium]MDZ4240932.1 protein translocase subunit SecF [Patescibacteria group bacterium]
MFIVKNRKFFYIFSGLLSLLSIVVIFMYGLNLGIDFKGGSLLELDFPNGRPDITTIKEEVAAIITNEPSIIPSGESGYFIRMRSLSEPEHQAVLEAISGNDKIQVEEIQFNSIGPVLGNESARNSLVSIVLVIVAILSYIAFAFRKVSEPVSSWKYGIIAIISLIHNILLPTGIFVVLGHFNPTVEIDTLFVTALLVVLGFSVHDNIVVFDRVRENLKYNKKSSFEETVGDSINQTLARSINTSLTTIFALVVLYFVGGEATRNFTLALLIGITAGTYSSICLGSPLLVTAERLQGPKKR